MSWLAMNFVVYTCLASMIFFGIRGSITNAR